MTLRNTIVNKRTVQDRFYKLLWFGLEETQMCNDSTNDAIASHRQAASQRVHFILNHAVLRRKKLKVLYNKMSCKAKDKHALSYLV